MRTFECENCGSLFVINECDGRVMSGDYAPPQNRLDCPLCNCYMYPVFPIHQEDND
jgi:hypothetical protein